MLKVFFLKLINFIKTCGTKNQFYTTPKEYNIYVILTNKLVIMTNILYSLYVRK